MYSVIKIDTKGICLLCLSSQDRRIVEGQEKESTSLKILCRYLKVDVSNLSTISALFQPINSDNVNLAVLLCDDCSSVANDFLELFQALEGIRLQLDLCVRQLHEFMEKGSSDSQRVQEYKRRMASESINDLINSNIANNLRQEIVEKVCQKLQQSLPRIILDTSTGKVSEWVKEKATSSHPSLSENRVEIVTEEAKETDPPESPLVSEQLQQEASQANSVYGEKSSSSSQSESQAVIEFTTLVDPTQIQVSLSKCVYCGKWFSQQKNLQAHLLQQHTTSVLSDQDYLHSNISELQLETALAEFAQKMKSRVAKCLFCKRRGFQSEHSVRHHLLQKHLNQLIEKTESVPVEMSQSDALPEQPEQVEGSQGESFDTIPTPNSDRESRKDKYCKCNYCGKYFPPSSLGRHQLRLHMMAALGDSIPPLVSERSVTEALTRITSKSSIISRRNGGNVSQCPFCESRVWCLKLHLLRLHLNEVILEATQGPAELVSSRLQAEFTDAVHKTQIKAPSSSSTGSTIPQRRGSVLSRSKHKCSYCGKLMSTKVGLKIHVARQHKMPKSTLKCDYCKGSFTQKQHLQTHLIRFHPASYFAGQLPAGISNQNFYDTVSGIARKSNNNAELKCSRQKSGAQTYAPKCPHCKKRFKWMNELKLHISSWHLNEVIAIIRLRLC